MFRSKAFSARSVYSLVTAESRSDIAMDLLHGEKDAYLDAMFILLFAFLVLI